MKAAVFRKPLHIAVEEVPIPALGPDDVLVRVKSVGICGSDFHYWKTGTIGDLVIREPLILGHEASGEIADLGNAVSNLATGDRVAVEPGVPCRKCRVCREGRYNLCPRKRFMSDPPTNGAFAEYVVWPSDFVFKLPQNLSFDEGALVEPLAVGVYAVRRARIGCGDTVTILGAGPVGLLTLVAAKNAGASEIFVTDIDGWRLEKARELGATATINARDDPVAGIQELTQGNYVDVTIETSGSTDATVQAVKATRRGGTIVLVGLYEKRQFTYPLLDVVMKELDVRGSIDYANSYPASLKLMASKTFDARSLITHHMRIDDIEKGFRIMAEDSQHRLKIMLHP
jgi:L-iditol 2-dehydrogenase